MAVQNTEHGCTKLIKNGGFRLRESLWAVLCWSPANGASTGASMKRCWLKMLMLKMGRCWVLIVLCRWPRGDMLHE